MSRNNKRLAERVSEVHDFNDEQLKQCARGIVMQLLEGSMDRTHAGLAMSLVLNEAATRGEQHQKRAAMVVPKQS